MGSAQEQGGAERKKQRIVVRVTVNIYWAHRCGRQKAKEKIKFPDMSLKQAEGHARNSVASMLILC